jgi:hypothetical protein
VEQGRGTTDGGIAPMGEKDGRKKGRLTLEKTRVDSTVVETN